MYFTSEAEIVETARAAVARATEAVKPVFARLPTLPMEVKPYPPEDQAYAGTASYQGPSPDGRVPARFNLVTQPPARQGRWQLEVTAFHEGIPGHHFQIARTLELGELPAFRRSGGSTAYIEGWGLYTERLCKELGLYSDDVAWLGALSLDALRATRLVVDTGLHHKRWGRTQAVDFFMTRNGNKREQVEPEVDRYCSWPGQACGYKVGHSEIVRQRSRAQQALGPAYDLRRFNDAVVKGSNAPLDVLARNVDRYIAAARG